MKRIIASAGIVAVGTAGLQATNYGDLAPDQASKRWSVSAAVRGFYDDNYTTRSGDLKRDSYGLQVSPSVALNLPLETSFASLAYIYSMDYYADRSDNEIDQSHDVRLNFDHRFSERHRARLYDQFVYSIEPTLIDQQGTVSVPLRADAEAIRNRATLSFDAQLTPVWSLLASYENNFYDYQDKEQPGSYSALLDRVEHLFRIDPRYRLAPHTVVFVGYQFGIGDYLSDQLLVPSGVVRGTDRGHHSHYGYLGAEHRLSANLSIEGRAGAQYVTYDELDSSQASPYVDLLGIYTYLPGSHLRAGVRHARNATDVAGTALTPDDVTFDQETTTAYVSVQHRLTALLTAGLLAQYQHSVYNGGRFDGDTDDYLSLGLTLAYRINRNWAVEANYYFDHLSSDAVSVDGSRREFTRNRFMAGVRATY